MFEYTALVRQLDDQVDQQVQRQVLNRQQPDYGGFRSPVDGLTSPNGVSAAAALGYAYLLEESRHYHSEKLVERILLAAAYGRRSRRPSGCFDLLITNFDSAPDTGFTVKALAPVVAAARRDQQDEGARRIAEELGELIYTAAPGMVKGGFHTPNHRWVLVAALAQAQTLFPDLAVGDTIEAYLAESIDINADGEYIERSTGVYNAICNRALRLAADALEQPQWLEPVRRNSELSYHLMHADATVVTSISSRQDRGMRTVPVSLADSYYWLARLDGNGFFAAVADWLVQQGNGGTPWTLQPFLARPEWRVDGLPREPLPQKYTKTYPVSGLWRLREGALSATAAAGLSAPFSLRYGQVELIALKLSSTYFATGQFIGEDFVGKGDRVCLHHYGRNAIYPEKEYRGGIYWLPIAEQVNAENWAQVRGRRATYELPALEVDLEIRRVDNGFDIHVCTHGGLEGVPFQIECVFAPGGEVDLESGALQAGVGQTVFLKQGAAIYHVGDDAVEVGPGANEHRMWQMRNSEASPEGCRILVALMTPVDQVLRIRCGRWDGRDVVYT